MRKILLIPSFTLCLLVAASCDHEPRNTDSHSIDRADAVLRRGNGGEPHSLDPILAEDIHTFNVLFDMYEGLVSESSDGSLVPGVAETWEISDDGLRYTFHLRDDARWSNGENVSADEFVAGIRRAVEPDSTSAYSFLLDPIRNSAAVSSGSLPVTDLGVHATGPRTLVIELSSPASYFLGILTMPIAFPYYSGDVADGLRFRDPQHFVGNGPYLLEDWALGERIRLRKNPNFRDVDNVQIDYVDYYPMSNPNTELNMYRADELDITATVPPEHIASLREKRPDELRIAPSLAVYYLAFDLTESPLDDPQLRQALSMAIDRNVLVQLLGRGEQAAFGFVPPGVDGHDPFAYSWQSLTDDARISIARDLYAKAGYGSDHPLVLKLTYDVGDIHEKIALAVESMWRDVLGAKITLEKKEWKLFLATRDNRDDWQVMRFAWFGDYNDASTFTDIFRADSSQNLPRYRNVEYDQILNEAASAETEGERRVLMTAAEQHLMQDYAIAPLYFFVSKHMVRSNIRGFKPNVLDHHPSRYLQKVNHQ